jgi:hypothetical protein
MFNNQSDIRSDKSVRIHTLPLAAAGKITSCALRPHEKYVTALVVGNTIVVITILGDWREDER